jgi:uncharacterized protein
MDAPTYNLRKSTGVPGSYQGAVGQLADWVLESGESLRQVVDAYGEFVELSGRERRRSNPEYLLEALMLGVFWRARGGESLRSNERRYGLVTEIVRERRAGASKRRDGSTAGLVTVGGATKRGRIDPTLQEIEQLFEWLLATGEYDDEIERLEGWKALLSTTQPATNREILRLIVAFSVRFEAKADRILGPFTEGVERFLREELATREEREDTAQCSRHRVEYHLNMVGAEILNRAWRRTFLACRRHVVVMPGCARARSDEGCSATRGDHDLKCTHCTLGCAISTATRLVEREGSEATTVLHGSDFSRFLESDLLAGDDVGIVGVACAPGLVGAGWRARAKGLAAQCVLLNASGCVHWRSTPTPTAFDLSELARILDRSDADERIRVAPRVA